MHNVRCRMFIMYTMMHIKDYQYIRQGTLAVTAECDIYFVSCSKQWARPPTSEWVNEI